MIVCICVIKSKGSIEGYRLMDSSTLEYKDVQRSSCRKNIGKVVNLEVVDGEIRFTGGQDSLYPVYISDTAEVYNKEMIVCVRRADGKLSKQDYIEEIMQYMHGETMEEDGSINTYVSNYSGEVQAVRPKELQDLIVDRKCLNVIEGYTGGLLDSSIYNYKRIGGEKVVCSKCFCYIVDMYRFNRKFKGADIVKFRNTLYNINEHRRVIRAKESQKVVKVVHCGILRSLQSVDLQPAYEKVRLPLYIENKDIYYVNRDKKVEKGDIMDYLASGLSEVFSRIGLLNETRESSFCMISANKIYLLAMNKLLELDRDTYENDIKKVIARRNKLNSKLKLMNNTDIIMDSRGSVVAYKVTTSNTNVNVLNSMEEFDLANITGGYDVLNRGKVTNISIQIPDDHKIVYISEPLVKYLRCTLLECNDTDLGKRILVKLLSKKKYGITWRINGSYVTPELVSWISKRENIKLDVIGDIQGKEI